MITLGCKKVARPQKIGWYDSRLVLSVLFHVIFQFFQHVYRILVLWVQLQGFLVVGHRRFLLTSGHISLAETVVSVCRIRIQLNIELENGDSRSSVVVPKQRVSEIVEACFLNNII